MDNSNQNLLSILITSWMGVTGLGFTTIQPVLLGGIVDQLNFDRAMVGWISTVNVIGIAIGGIVITLLIGRFSLLRMIQVGLIGLVLFDVGSIFIQAEFPMLVIRSLSGFFGGLVYAGAMAAFSGFKDNIKAFGIYVMVYSFWSILALFALPDLIEWYGLILGFGTLLLLTTISIIGSFMLRLPPIRAKEMISLKDLLSQRLVVLSLLSYFMMQLAGGVVWAYLERIAKEAAISSTFTGIALSVSGVVALASGWIVLEIGTKWGIKKPFIGGILIMIISAISLLASEFQWIYLIGLSIFCGGWAFLIPYYQKIQAQFDISGKVVSLGTIVNMGGRAAGPALAALLLSDVAYVQVIWIGVVALIIGWFLMLPIFNRTEVI